MEPVPQSCVSWSIWIIPFWGMPRKVCWKGSWYFWRSLCNFIDMHMKLCSNSCVCFWLWEAQVGLLSKFYMGMRVRSHQTRCDSYLGWILWRSFDESFWRLCFSPSVYKEGGVQPLPWADEINGDDVVADHYHTCYTCCHWRSLNICMIHTVVKPLLRFYIVSSFSSLLLNPESL